MTFRTLDYDEYDALLQQGQEYIRELLAGPVLEPVGQWAAGTYRLPDGSTLDVYGDGTADHRHTGWAAPTVAELVMRNALEADALVLDAVRTLARARDLANGAAHGRHATPESTALALPTADACQRALDALARRV